MFVETGKVVGAAVDGSEFEEKAGGGAVEGAVWGFRHIGAGDEGFELKLAVDPAGGPVRITVVDQSPGIDAPGAARPGPDGMYARSWVAGTTLVQRSYSFRSRVPERCRRLLLGCVAGIASAGITPSASSSVTFGKHPRAAE